MTDSSPTPLRTRIANGLVIALIIAVFPLLTYLWFWWQAGTPPTLFTQPFPDVPPANTREILTLNAGESQASTATYSGEVRLVIEGYWQAAPRIFVDAFYQFTDENGFPLETARHSPIMLALDGQPTDDALTQPLPRFSAFHVYELRYDMGQTARPLHLALGQLTDDAEVNTGVLRVYIAQP